MGKEYAAADGLVTCEHILKSSTHQVFAVPELNHCLLGQRNCTQNVKLILGHQARTETKDVFRRHRALLFRLTQKSKTAWSGCLLSLR
jgi:hypothetical protein